MDDEFRQRQTDYWLARNFIDAAVRVKDIYKPGKEIDEELLDGLLSRSPDPIEVKSMLLLARVITVNGETGRIFRSVPDDGEGNLSEGDVVPEWMRQVGQNKPKGRSLPPGEPWRWG